MLVERTMNSTEDHSPVRDYRVFYDAIDSSINGVVITDLEGKIEYVNPSFLRMFEYENDSDVLGKKASDLFVSAEVKSLSDVEAIIDREIGNTEEFPAHRRDGSTFIVEVSSSTVQDKNGTVVGRMASFIDITKRKMAEEKNRVLSKQLIKSQEVERERIAQDLHDGIAQTLHAAKLNLVAFMKEPGRFRERFKVGIECLDKASQELREVCDDLYPSILRDYGLESAVKWYAKNYLELQGITTELNISLSEPPDKDLEVQLYRVIKEIFSNIIRHSHCNSVELLLLKQNGKIVLSIKDNGIGFDMETLDIEKKGFGLFSISQRASELNGDLVIDSRPGKGTEIRIILKAPA